MLLDTNATIRYRNGLLHARLAFEEGLLILHMDGYMLRTNPALDRPWEIAEESLKESGNRYGFDLTGSDPYEITNFELEFRFETFLIGSDLCKAMELTVLAKYTGTDHMLRVSDPYDRIHSGNRAHMEAVFDELHDLLSTPGQYLKSCFACGLSGYERGGSTLFCMKNSREQLLSKPYLEQYRNHFTGLHTEVVPEFYHCRQFEINPDKTIT